MCHACCVSKPLCIIGSFPGLKFLHGMKLSQVNLDGTGVTAEGVAKLISTSPHLISIRANNTRPVPAERQSDDDDAGEDGQRHRDISD